MTEIRFKLVDDYLIEYDGDYFDLHKPSDIRSLVNVIKYVTDENEQLKSTNMEYEDALGRLEEENEQLKQFKNLAIDYNIPFDKLCSAFEDSLYCDCYTDCKNAIENYRKENEQLKQSIKEIDDAELHLKQIILKRIDDYIWEWEDEGTPVAQVLRELRDEIKRDDVE